ncbi:MAG: O-methyltransferase [Deltaproteobacteria bacterium]|nr:O-methyltransferase [Deltaproteobacteria bacterium]
MADNDSRAGQRYADAEIMSWVDDVHARHDDALELAFGAPGREDMPAIQVGRSEGKFLELLTRLTGAQRVVEVGTLAGYSTIRLARGMAGGKIWSVEYDPRHAEVAREQIAAAGLDHSIEVVVGSGVEVLPTLEQHGPFDMVFVDADKDSYAFYGQWAANNLCRGGLLIGDNAFLFGKLLEDTPRGSSMRRFHEDAAKHFDSVCLPTPDGMLVGIRL